MTTDEAIAVFLSINPVSERWTLEGMRFETNGSSTYEEERAIEMTGMLKGFIDGLKYCGNEIS
ncbi:TPA: hypothetical protein PXI74_003870 [Yersinia enterocolitica]|uniref:hypothetical protein n=1 Tax=Yersinia enterocolitica TaxID=630 RepID=UPI002AC57CFD|nr:hypothetical protein [Yersinia enterocolitica]HEN3517247.1 hypothetical protein [Yersinia enterocolitica]